jgi:molybdenum cofactor cytidylyltransferase
MQLREALQVGKGEVVSLVGAGGKTTTMYRLASELADQGWRVIATTTTKIRPPSPAEAQVLVVERDSARALRSVAEALRHGGVVALAAERLEPENKLRGIQPALVTQLAGIAEAIIVEADGARGRSLKVPASYEPVIPQDTTLLVPVVGIDAVGSRLSEEMVHRPKLVSELTGLPWGEPIGTSIVSTLLVHERGALKGTPSHARVVPLINKVHSAAQLEAAHQIAADIKGDARLARVLIGAVVDKDPILECWRHVSAVVLAAGASKRLGSPKQLLDIAGAKMIEHVLRAVESTSVDEVIVVLGHEAAQIARFIPAWCRVLHNPNWEEGIASSIRTGLGAVDRRAKAAIFVLADQPSIGSEAIERILQAYYGSTKPIVVPIYRGRRGSPVLFDRLLFPVLETLQGDVGGRQVLDRFVGRMLTVEMSSAEVFFDIDTVEDYHLFQSKGGIQGDA